MTPELNYGTHGQDKPQELELTTFSSVNPKKKVLEVGVGGLNEL